MKMHFLNGGRLRVKKRVYVPEADEGATIEVPVFAALFRHAKGNVLFDTGCHPAAAKDPVARWGDVARYATPLAGPGANVVSGLAALDLSPDDIDLVVNSHLHPDHCGCNAFFRKATFIVHEAELTAANADDAAARGYLRAEWEHPMPIRAVDTSHDLLGDGRLVTIPLPGHTAGTMGLRADLHRGGPFLLASDSVNLKRNLDRDEVPGNTWNADLMLQSYATVREVETQGATVICGHDVEQWRVFRKGANAYD